MILKRYEYWGTENGKPIKKWTEWFNYREDNGELETLRKEEKWQLKGKLLNEYKVV